MSATYQKTGAFCEVLERLATSEVTVEIPWSELADHQPLVLVRREGDRIICFDPSADPADSPPVGEAFEDSGPPRLAAAEGLASIALAELEARFEYGEGRGFLPPA